MKDIILVLAEQKAWLERILSNTQKRTCKDTEGYLSISMIKGKPRFYHCLGKDESGHDIRRYMSADDMKAIERLAQANYDRKVVKAALHQLEVINRFIREYDPMAVRKIREDMSSVRQQLVIPEELSDAEYAEYWRNVEYVPGEFEIGAPVIMTDRGERVRSKSERDIANRYNQQGIPYRYEYPHVMPNGHLWYPDFTVLNVRTREEFIHEHFGKMDDLIYVNNSIGKLEIYQKSGYYLGENLLLTMETQQRPFDVRNLDPLIDKYLK